MFFSIFDEKEKKAFYQLAKYTIHIDSDVHIDEVEYLRRFCSESNLPKDYSREERQFDLEEALSQFKYPESKKACFLEILILIHIDEVFAAEEKELVEKLIDFFDFNTKFRKKALKFAKKHAQNYVIGKKLIHEA